METTELYYPQIVVKLGDYCFDRGIEIEVVSAKSSYFDWAKVRFTEQFQEKINLPRKAFATIKLGYGGAFHDVFGGYVAKPYNGGSFADEVILKDDMIRLEETIITDTFLNSTPQELISFFLARSGITNAKLNTQAYPVRKVLPIRQQTAIQAINAVHAAWNTSQPFFFSGGIFYWGEQPKQERVYSFEYGVNILSLNRTGGNWVIETISAPFIKHSHKINIIHPKITGEFEASKVIFITNDHGFIRTYIYFDA